MTADLRQGAKDYLDSAKKEYREYTNDWDMFSREVPQKFLSLVKSGIKPSISRDSSRESGSRTLGINIEFQSNMDGARAYLEKVPDLCKEKGERFCHKVVEIDKKLQSFKEGGLENDLLAKLGNHLLEWIYYVENMTLKIRDAEIRFTVPDEITELKKKWKKEAHETMLLAESEKYGVAVADLEKHKKYLDAKEKKDVAKTSADMEKVVRVFSALDTYLDAKELAEACREATTELKQKEEEEIRLKKEAEEAKKREEEQKRKEEYEVWKKEVADIKAKKEECKEKHSTEVEKKCEEKKQQIRAAKEKELNDTNAEIKHTEEAIAQAQAELPTLGLFKGKRKKELRFLIAESETKLTDLREKLTAIEAKAKKDLQRAEAEVVEKKRSYEQDLEIKYKIPISPDEKRRKQAEEAERKRKEEEKLAAMSDEQRRRANMPGIKGLILDTVERLGDCTISEVMDAEPELAEYSNQRIAATMRQLRDEGELIRYEEKRKAYFRLP